MVMPGGGQQHGTAPHSMIIGDVLLELLTLQASAVEGFARYQDALFTDGGQFAPAGSQYAAELDSCVQPGFGGMPSNQQNYQGSAQDAACGYVVSASAYAYMAARGVSPYGAALDAYGSALDPTDAAAGAGAQGVSIDDWSSWVTSTR